MNLVIAATGIKKDKHGRYCLNDLHKASGGEWRHTPKYWVENAHTAGLVHELTDGGIPPSPNNHPIAVVKGGKNQGTYVVKELVYAYAMWISPKFHLQVIRTFDEVMRAENKRSLIRDTASLEYKPMSSALKDERAKTGKDTRHFHYSNEADLINRIAIGTTSKEFRKANNVEESDAIRDYLTPEEIRAVMELQRANTVFISMGMTFDQRREQLNSLFDRNHKDALIEEHFRLEA